jgi:hypothetical protein
MPVRAVEVVKAKGWSGPLYNDFNWGGYLIWALRQPVAASMGAQTRMAMSGSIARTSTWNAQPGWASDPDLQSAKLVIAPVNAPLTQVLRLDTRFEVAYEDKLAVVFLARNSQSSGAGASVRLTSAH